MVSPLVYYQLALLAIIWLFVMLHLTGSKPARTTPPVPAQPKRKRSTEPTAFEGLTHKPHCALCERETAPSKPRRRCHRTLCRPRTDAPVRSTRPCTFVLIWAVTIAAGWG
jgi:hypothetical protein